MKRSYLILGIVATIIAIINIGICGWFVLSKGFQPIGIPLGIVGLPLGIYWINESRYY